MKISTLSRDVTYDIVKQLVEDVMASHSIRLHLPILIMYLRNHPKSLAPGVGGGEKSVPIKLLCALYELDSPMATALVKDLVLYGSWQSLLRLLAFTDSVCKENDGEAFHPSSNHRFSELQGIVHKLFADQMKADEESNSHGGGVSNASKFSPHENRSDYMQYHGDCIAKIIFQGSFDDDPSNKDKSYALRRLFRKLRAKLNAANNHIAEIFLSCKRAADLHPTMICAGTFAKCTKALLNRDRKGNERSQDEGRRLLRTRILAAIEKRPGAIPAPSDLFQLAERLLAIHGDPAADDGERLVLRASYSSAVRELRDGVAAAAAGARDLIEQADLDEAERADALAEVEARPMAVAIECTLGNRATLPVSCLLAMLFADADESTAAGAESSAEAGPAGTGRRPAAALLFSDEVTEAEIPPADGGAEERLAALVAAAGARLAAGGGGGVSDYEGALRGLDGAAFAGRDALLCSDFRDSERVLAAVRAWRAGPGGVAGEGAAGRALSCWRMVQPKLGRARRAAWDPARPRVDVVLCMDTTGSMGGCIAACKEQAPPPLPFRPRPTPIPWLPPPHDAGRVPEAGAPHPAPPPDGLWLLLRACSQLREAAGRPCHTAPSDSESDHVVGERGRGSK